MAWQRPLLKDLIERTTADLVARLSLQGAILRRAFVRILAKVWAGLVHGVYGHQVYVSRQILVSTADGEKLDDHGIDFKLPRKAAAFASGSITLTGTDGAVVGEKTRWQRSDGVEYESDAPATIAGGTATVAVTALMSAENGNCAAGVQLALVSAIAGISSIATVAAGGLIAGADVESHEDYRARLLSRKANTPMGGAKADYLKWALEVPGVTRVWVSPTEMGPNSVVVRFMRDNDATAIPDAGEVAAVQAYIDDDTRRPVTASVYVVAPIADVLNFTIQLTPSTDAVKAAVEASLEDMIRREGEPGVTTLISHIREAISIAAGETDHVLTVPAADVPHATGHVPTMGVITWL